MLTSYRVLDFTDHRGQLAGAMLAALGAEVVLVEPPGGSPSRSYGAHVDGTSLWWWTYNRGKKSVVARDADHLRRLVAAADVLIDTGDLLGLDRAEPTALNPALVHVTISPFGTGGPKGGWAASDLTVAAAGCQLAITGDLDRAPVRTAVPQAYLHGSAEAACGALMALHERARTGRGQHVDVSTQQAFMQAAVPAPLASPNGAAPVERTAGGLTFGAWKLQFVYPASDGHVSVTLLFGDTIGPFTARLLQWAWEEGHCDETMRDKDWVNYGTALLTGAESEAGFEEVKAAITALCSSHTKAELFAEARRRRLLLAPVATVEDLLESEQLASRNWWEKIDDPALGRSVRAPGPFARLSASPLRTLGRPPRLDEHGAELADPVGHHPDVPATAPGEAKSGRPLDGLKVVDLSWVYAGPLATRLLADFGATVVKVESSRRPDASRGGGPFLEGDLGPDGSGQYAHLNAGKLGLSLDLGTEAGRAVLLDLVRWADVLVESYTPGVMDDWGVGWETLSATNPRLVMLSTCLMGQTGPERTFAGFGNLAGAVTGFYDLTGWPDRAPAGPFLAYTDYTSPRFMAAAVFGALEWRRRSGRGQLIDLSQAESSIHFLAPALVEAQVGGFRWSRLGNADRFLAPHAVYPARGDDAWVAVVCETDAQWAALAAELGRPDLAGLDAAERLTRVTELDQLVAAFTSARPVAEIEARLQAMGVPVHGVQNSGECAADPQLTERQHFRRVAHPVHRTCVVEGPRLRLSRTPGRVERAGPSLGEDNDVVLRDLLGYDDDRITDLVIAGALE